MRHIAAALLVLWAGPAVSEEWQPFATPDDLAAHLIAHELTYADGARQGFFASGRTLYEFGEPSWGYWRLENGRYCSRWPPGDTWDCYDVTRDAVGNVRFVDEWDNVSIGQVAP